jgi:ferredoxin
MPFRIEVDQTMCIAAATCITAAPAAFALNEENVAAVLPGAATLSDEELLRIARGCPSGALTVHTADGEEVELFG